jgi:hypothetical protein
MKKAEILIAAFLALGCSSEYVSIFHKPIDRAVLINEPIHVPKDATHDAGMFRIIDLDRNDDGIADIRVWYVYFGAEEDEQAGTRTLHVSLKPHIIERLRLGFFSDYREVYDDLTSDTPTRVFRFVEGKWQQIYPNNKKELR